MKTQISPEVFARAMVVAENLKQQLEARLLNKAAPAWNCSCGNCGAGPSRVVAINPPTNYPDQIGRWLSWACEMEDNNGKRWTQNIGSYIPWTELYPMFRNAFAGIEVRVEHPFAQSYSCQPAPFTPSGRTIELSRKSPVFVRPRGDLSQSVWINAELRIDKRLPNYATEDGLIACNIDALEFGQKHGRGQGNYCYLAGPSGGPAFYIRIAGDGHGQDLYLPIARQVTANKTAGTATLELDQSVEVFVPA
ncbi:hypothetical protein KA344_06905 [bacterium]|nr:hypothetical protein [bacterium]